MTIASTEVSVKANQQSTAEDDVEKLINQISGLRISNRKSILAYSSFALNFFRTASDAKSNFVYSPLSMGTALSMLMHGARGKTKVQIKNLLCKGESIEDLSAFFSNLIHAVSKSDASAITAIIGEGVSIEKNYSENIEHGIRPDTKDVSTSTINTILVDKTSFFSVDQDFSALVESVFGAKIGTLAFKDPFGAANVVNSYVTQQTNNMINQIVSESDFSDLSRAVLLSITTFEAGWEFPFSEELTSKRTFKGINGNREEDFMYKDSAFNFYEDDEVTALCLPYKDELFRFVAILPNGPFDGWLTSLSAEKLAAAMDRLQREEIARAVVRLPKFSIDSTVGVKEAMEKLGVTDCFKPLEADLTGMSKQPGLYVGDIFHKAFIDIDEKGTRAAGATVEGLIVLCPKPDLRFDRPFLYCIMLGNVPLFIGQFV